MNMQKQLVRELDKTTAKRLKELAGQHKETPLEIAERWQRYFAGRTFSDSTELIRKHREG